jgi:hypothetical protein
MVERVRGSQSDKREATVRITAKGRCLRQQLDRLMLARAESLWQAMPATGVWTFFTELRFQSRRDCINLPSNEERATLGDMVQSSHQL